MFLDEIYLSFFTTNGTEVNKYNNSNLLYNGVNNRITNLELKFDGKLLLS